MKGICVKTPGQQTIPPEFQLVVDAFAHDRSVTAGSMFGADNIVLNVQGRIFVMLVNGTFVAKLPRTRVDELVTAGHGVRLSSGQGRMMKEWIALDLGPEAWLPLAREARLFVLSLCKAG